MTLCGEFLFALLESRFVLGSDYFTRDTDSLPKEVLFAGQQWLLKAGCDGP